MQYIWYNNGYSFQVRSHTQGNVAVVVVVVGARPKWGTNVALLSYTKM